MNLPAGLGNAVDRGQDPLLRYYANSIVHLFAALRPADAAVAGS